MSIKVEKFETKGAMICRCTKSGNYSSTMELNTTDEIRTAINGLEIILEDIISSNRKKR